MCFSISFQIRHSIFQQENSFSLTCLHYFHNIQTAYTFVPTSAPNILFFFFPHFLVEKSNLISLYFFSPNHFMSCKYSKSKLYLVSHLLPTIESDSTSILSHYTKLILKKVLLHSHDLKNYACYITRSSLP